MSFFDDASLAFLPSGAAGKDGKAYSIKPTDGTGDFTFSRGSNLSATRIGSDGLIEKGRENLILQSNQFDTTWTKSNTSVTSGQSGYDGSTNAWKLEADSDGNGRRINQSITQGGVSIFSVYVKAGTTDFIRLNLNGAGNCFFNISESSPSVLTSSDVNLIGSIQTIGNGWNRCSLLNLTGSSIIEVRINLASGDNDLSAVTGDNIYIQDSQLEIGLAATEVISTGATTGKAGLLEDEPRFDYSGDCPSLLLEPSRTQLIGQTEYPSAFFGSDIEFTISPDGSLNAVKVIEQNTNSQHFVTFTSLNIVSGTTYAISFYCKKGSYSSIYVPLQSSKINANLSINFDTQSVTLAGPDIVINSEFIQSVGNGWYRVGFAATANSTGTMDFYACISASLSSYQGDGTSYTEFYGFQTEAGSYPTSYIPNHSGGTITRGTDYFDTGVLPSGILPDSTEWTIYVESENVQGSQRFIDGKNTIDVYPVSNNLRFYWRADGSYLSSTSGSKIVARLSNGVGTDFQDGVQTGTGARTGDYSGMRFQRENQINSVGLKKMIIFPTALSDADCITLTTI